MVAGRILAAHGQKISRLRAGESASATGREHIPPRLFKQAVHLNRQRDIILQTLKDITLFNAGRKSAEVYKRVLLAVVFINTVKG